MVGYQKYQVNQVKGSGPLGLIILTYGALLKSLGQARIAVDNGDIQAESYYTSKAIEAIIELSSSLRYEQGGEVAQHLSQLYNYMNKRLIDEMCASSTDAIDEAMQITQSLLEGWKGIEQTPKHIKLPHHPSPANIYAS